MSYMSCGDDKRPAGSWAVQHKEFYARWRELVGDQLLGGEAQLAFPDPTWSERS